jgi:hypothetical protein
VKSAAGGPKGLLGSGPSRVESMETDAEFGMRVAGLVLLHFSDVNLSEEAINEVEVHP